MILQLLNFRASSYNIKNESNQGEAFTLSGINLHNLGVHAKHNCYIINFPEKFDSATFSNIMKRNRKINLTHRGQYTLSLHELILSCSLVWKFSQNFISYLSIFANSCKESEKAKETSLINQFKQRETEHLIDGGKDKRIDV